MSILVISSLTYCDAHLTTELGRIPIAFLPVGDRRLFEIQHTIVPSAHRARTALAVPDDFVPDDRDRSLLDELGIAMVPLSLGLDLCETLSLVLQHLAVVDEEVRVVEADRLILHIPYDHRDVVSVAYPNCDASFQPSDIHGVDPFLGFLPPMENPSPTLSGYSCFGSSALLLRALSASGTFRDTLIAYNAERTLTPLCARITHDLRDHLSYRRARRHVVAHRTFNEVTIRGDVVTKSSYHSAKLLAEASWYDSIPESLAANVPRLIDVGQSAGKAWYQIEYVPFLLLSDRYVFGQLPDASWQGAFLACADWLARCAAFRPLPDEYDWQSTATLYGEKTLRRLDRFALATGISTTAEWSLNGRRLPSLQRIVLDAATTIPPPSVEDICVAHGDLCFGNILYDVSTQQLRLIDPRGLDGNGERSVFGDQRYDIAKLHHSVIGLYDFILAGRYDLVWSADRDIQFRPPSDTRITRVQAIFLESMFHRHTTQTAASLGISILLFLAMLPLHSDNAVRQRALLANALRLYLSLEEDGL